MTEKIQVEKFSDENINAMQAASDALVETMRFLVPPRGERSLDEYDSLIQHTIFGNAVIRVLISMSEKLGPLDLGAIRHAGFQAISYVSSIAQPVHTEPTSGGVS